MKISFLKIAQIEFEEAVDYYNLQSEGLGFDFALEVKKTLERIFSYPNAWASLSKNTKRCRCNRFPYGVVYQIRDDELLVISVMHLHREPGMWEDRINCL